MWVRDEWFFSGQNEMVMSSFFFSPDILRLHTQHSPLRWMRTVDVNGEHAQSDR